MQKHNIIFLADCLQIAQSNHFRLLRIFSASQDFLYLFDSKLVQESLQIIFPACNTRNHNCINLRVLFKYFQCINYDRFPIQLQKLFWLCAVFHTLTGATGKYQCYIHVIYLLRCFCTFYFASATLLYFA